MKELLEVIVKNLIDDTDSIFINEIQDGNVTILELKVSDKDVGKVIGKNGKIAKAIRTVVKAAASYENKKVLVKII